MPTSIRTLVAVIVVVGRRRVGGHPRRGLRTRDRRRLPLASSRSRSAARRSPIPSWAPPIVSWRPRSTSGIARSRRSRARRAPCRSTSSRGRWSASLVSAVRSVMHDATWRCAVLASDDPELLPPAVYHGADDARRTPIGDLEQWASVSIGSMPASPSRGPVGRVRRRRRRGQRPAARDPLRTVGGPRGADARGARTAHPCRTALRHGARALAAVRPRPQPGR